MRKKTEISNAKMEKYIDKDWYLSEYPDVAENDADPIRHFMESGGKEGRWPNPFFDTAWYVETYMAGATGKNPLAHFIAHADNPEVTPNWATSVAWITNSYPELARYENVLDFLMKYGGEIDELSPSFSRAFYLKRNPDVAEAGVVPEYHWLRFGIKEARQPHPDHAVVQKDEINWRKDRFLSYQHSDGETFYLKNTGLNASIKAQIVQQAQFDPDVLCIGAKAFAGLRKFDADDLATRDLVDFERLVEEFDETDTVLLMPFLGIGGAEKYAANIAGELIRQGQRVTVMTTESNRHADAEALQLPNMRAFRRCNIISLWPYLERNWRKSNMLALILVSLKPKNVFVINSDLGLECIQNYGRALSQFCNLYTCFFSQAPIDLGATYPARYLHSILGASNLISDNRTALKQFSEVTGNIFNEKLIYLPQEVNLKSDVEWTRLVADRRAMHKGKKNSFHVLWASRWEPFKAVNIVIDLAKKHSDLEIHVYGASPTDHHVPKDIPDNLQFQGMYNDLARVPVSQFDIFLFTSLFEGMPNIVLEMANEGIPIVASDVGGISEIFGNGEIELIAMDGSDQDIAGKFYRAIKKLAREPAKEMEKRLESQRKALLKNHAREVFSSRLHTILNQ